MAQLKENWFVEGLQDFEYKRYLLLAYLKWVKEKFGKTELYPALSQLIGHYRNLLSFHENKSAFEESLPRELSGIDWEKLQLLYGEKGESESLKEIEDIVNYALPLFRHRLRDGKEIYDFIEAAIEIESVGVMPLNKDEGYLLLRIGNQKAIKAYRYRVSIFESHHEKFRGLQTELLHEFELSISNSFEQIKIELLRQNRGLPNPATFSVVSRYEFPEQPSLVPVARRKFMQWLAQSA